MMTRMHHAMGGLSILYGNGRTRGSLSVSDWQRSGEIALPLVCAGSVSMLSLMDHHCWLAYVLDLFAKLPMLNTFFCIMRTDELFRCEIAQHPPAW